MEKKLKKQYPTDSNSLIVQNFMAGSLLNLVDNLTERIHKIKCKYEHDKKCKTYGIKYKDCKCCLQYINIKSNLVECNLMELPKNF